LSEIWDGRPITRVRALDGATVLPGRRLAAHLMVQPDAAAAFLSESALRDQGLLSRLLVAAPDSLAGQRRCRDTAPEEDEAIRAYAARLLTVLEARPAMAEGKRNELAPRALPLSAEAARLWRAFHDHVEEQVGPGGPLRPVRDLAAKAAEHAARLAGVLTLVADLGAEEIGEGAMGYGSELTSWYLGEALRMQAAGRTNPGLLQAKALLDWLQGRADERGEVSFRDALQSGPAALRTKVALEGALKALTDHGWIEEASARPRRVRVWAGSGEAKP
jgi:hypothetical protein